MGATVLKRDVVGKFSLELFERRGRYYVEVTRDRMLVSLEPVPDEREGRNAMIWIKTGLSIYHQAAEAAATSGRREG